MWKAEVNDVAHTPLGATWTGIHPTLKSYVDVAFAAGAPRPVSCIMCHTLHHAICGVHCIMHHVSYTASFPVGPVALV